jgi:type IV secretory pathway TrbD component
MSDYQVVATVTSLTELKNVITDYHLKRGDRVRLKLDVVSPMGYLFNLAGAELAFSPLMPEHMNLIDVWGEGNSGYVEMEATSPPLAAVLGFIADNWLAVTIAGVVVAVIIIAITVSVKIAQANPNLVSSLVIAGAVVLGSVYIISHRGKST